MIRRELTITAVLLALSATAPPAAGQSVFRSERVDTIVVTPPFSSLRLPARYTQPRLDFSLQAPERPNLQSHAGFEMYRLSPMQSALKGAGAGLSAGFMAGAFGEMTGAWSEKNAFGIAGITAIAGGLYGNSRAADDRWSLQLRFDRGASPPGSTPFPPAR